MKHKIKLTILLNSLDIDISKDLQAVKDFYASSFDLEFRTIKTKLNVKWTKEIVDREWAMKNMIVNNDDVFGLVVDEKEWQGKNWLGYSDSMDYQNRNFFVIKYVNQKDSKNRQVNNNSQLAGTIRHEIAHTLCFMAKTKDEVHTYDYNEKKGLDVWLENFPASKLIALEKDQVKLCQLPMQDTRRTGYRYLDKIKGGGLHSGLDINWGKTGDSDKGVPVMPMHEGVVEYVGRNIVGWGNMVVMYHPKLHVWTRYTHLDTIYTIKKGDYLLGGSFFGTCGGTSGRVEQYSPHVHFDIIQKKLTNWTDYTTGMTAEQVKEYYLDPDYYIDETNKKIMSERWKQEALEWAIENEVSNGERPNDNITRVEVMEMLRKYNKKFNGK